MATSTPGDYGKAQILILDTETTGLDPKKGACAIEVGAVLFSVEYRQPLQCLSFLLPTDRNEAEHVNRIPAGLTKEPQPLSAALELFGRMVTSADLAMAHNAPFDRKWFDLDPLPALGLPWVCSMTEIPWGPMPGRSLKDLALAHGLAVTPDHHRALPDALLLAGVLAKRSDLPELLKKATKPRATFRAVIPFERKDEAKAAGFQWNPELRQWRKRLADDEIESLSFPVVLC